MSDWSKLELVWRDAVPGDDVIAMVRDDIKSELVDLERPSDLVFHTVFLTATSGGPVVVVSGFDGRDDAFDAGYYP